MPTQPNQQPGSNQFTASDGTQLNPTAATLTRAIRQVESGGDYNAVGDNGDSKGAYQFNKNNFSTWATQYGLDPNDFSPVNQDKVAYTRINDLLKQGYTQSQVAALWNGAAMVDGKPVANNPQYPQKVQQAYQQIASAPPQSSPQVATVGGAFNGALPPPPSSNTGLGIAEASTDNTNTIPESMGQKALDVAGGVGNFLFPIGKDLYNDATGKNTGTDQKSGLQQTGDALLSVLPFIPGLDVAGEAARGAEVAGEGAAKVAPGILSKIAGSSLARNTAAGYGSGVAQNLSQGEGLGQSFMPNENTIGGSLLGAGGSLLTKGLGGIVEKATGIPKNRIPALAGISDPKLYDEYANVGAARAADERNPTLLEHGIQYFKNAVDSMQGNLKGVQKSIGDMAVTQGDKPLQDVTPALQNFQNNLEKYFGKTATISKNGSVSFESLPGRVKNTLSPADTSRLKGVLKQVVSLGKDGNVQKASDVLDNIDNEINYGKSKYFGGNDPIQGFLKQTRHDLNGVRAQSSPELAALNQRASGLHQALGDIESAGGSNLQRGGLLLKRMLSGDQGQVSRNVFNTIQKETGINLQDHATLIKHFVDSMGDKSEQSTFQKLLEESTSKGGTTLTDLALKGGKGFLQSTVANPVKVGRNIVQGKTGIVNKVLSKGRPTKSLLELGRLIGQ